MKQYEHWKTLQEAEAGGWEGQALPGNLTILQNFISKLKKNLTKGWKVAQCDSPGSNVQFQSGGKY